MAYTVIMEHESKFPTQDTVSTPSRRSVPEEARKVTTVSHDRSTV